MKKVAVIIPIYNGIKYTLKCLESLSCVDFPGLEIIVVDDGSTDGSSQIIREKYPNTIVLHGDGELWWSGAMNVGIRFAMEREFAHVVLLNHDNVVDPMFLSSLLSTAIQNPRSIVGSIVFYVDRPHTVRYAGGKINWFLGQIEDTHLGEIDSGQFNAPVEVDWLGGMGVIVPIETFQIVGLFDDVWFPHYAGDQDLWLRAKKKGFRILVEPRSKVWVHEEHTGSKLGQTGGATKFFQTLFDRKFHANIPTTIRFFWRHSPPFALPIGLPSHYCISAFRFGKTVLMKRKKKEVNA
jgi:GT2 family glycosyltransferase